MRFIAVILQNFTSDTVIHLKQFRFECFSILINKLVYNVNLWRCEAACHGTPWPHQGEESVEKNSVMGSEWAVSFIFLFLSFIFFFILLSFFYLFYLYILIESSKASREAETSGVLVIRAQLPPRNLWFVSLADCFPRSRRKPWQYGQSHGAKWPLPQIQSVNCSVCLCNNQKITKRHYWWTTERSQKCTWSNQSDESVVSWEGLNLSLWAVRERQTAVCCVQPITSQVTGDYIYSNCLASRALGALRHVTKCCHF